MGEFIVREGESMGEFIVREGESMGEFIVREGESMGEFIVCEGESIIGGLLVNGTIGRVRSSLCSVDKVSERDSSHEGGGGRWLGGDVGKEGHTPNAGPQKVFCHSKCCRYA